MTGRIVAVYGNMVTAETEHAVVQNSIARCRREDGARLLAEVIRIRDHRVDLQVFEETRGLRIGDAVEFQHEMLSVSLGPGLLGQIYDGLQNPLPELAARSGFFLRPGEYLPGLPQDRPWRFTPRAESLDVVGPGDTLGTVTEGMFQHRIMAPFALRGRREVAWIAPPGEYTVQERVALLVDGDGEEQEVTMEQRWPVKVPLLVCRRRLMPSTPMVTGVRIIDSLFPIVHGGTYCIPGPFGAGKTVLQQITSRHADVDVVIVAACGERAGEVVETIREFPGLEDPRTGRTLMERTIIVCNTSAMPVAAREASVYTAATLGEYYRQMGLRVLLLADSTSRWAQAMREVSGRLEEIPGEEAFPAYLESRIAGFYERAGAIELADGHVGSLTIGGTVSPAGGNFEEPVTQGTVKVVGAFHGLSTARAHARRYPAIDPLQSWSRYRGILDPDRVRAARALLRRGDDIRQMMTVVGEDGVPVRDFTIALKAEIFDRCYLQQDAFDPVDGATGAERQRFVFDRLMAILETDFPFQDREQARAAMVRATDLFLNLNYAPFQGEEFGRILAEIASASANASASVANASGERAGAGAGGGRAEGGGAG
jgi:V/A-type H+/Na+-transporting ATPase subunit A